MYRAARPASDTNSPNPRTDPLYTRHGTPRSPLRRPPMGGKASPAPAPARGGSRSGQGKHWATGTQARVSPEAGRGPRRAESGRCLRNVSPSPAVYRLSGGRPALGNGRILKCAASRGQPDRGSAPTRRGRSTPRRAARPRACRARPRSAGSRSPRTGRRSFARAATAPGGRRAALAPYGVPAPAARIRPAFKQRPRDGGDVPIRAGARVPGRSTPSRS
jgi:hypothetical protein